MAVSGDTAGGDALRARVRVAALTVLAGAHPLVVLVHFRWPARSVMTPPFRAKHDGRQTLTFAGAVVSVPPCRRLRQRSESVCRVTNKTSEGD